MSVNCFSIYISLTTGSQCRAAITQRYSLSLCLYFYSLQRWRICVFPLPSPLHHPHFLIPSFHLNRMEVLAMLVHAQSCLTLCNPTDCSPLDSSVYGILQARTQECFLLQGNFPALGIEPMSSALTGNSLPLRHLGNAGHSPIYSVFNCLK